MRRTNMITLTGALFAMISAQAFGQRAAALPKQPGHTEWAASMPAALSAARGQDAIRVLKDENIYDSLAAAFQAALYRVERQPTGWHASNPAPEDERGRCRRCRSCHRRRPSRSI